MIVNVHENTGYTNEDHNYALCVSFSCTRCEMHFTSMEEFTSHCETHRIALERHLTDYLPIHSGDKPMAPFKCDVCDLRFSWKGSLTRHLKMHSEERPFECAVCDKRFILKSSLTAHLQIHSGE